MALAIGLTIHPFTATGFTMLGAVVVGIWSYGASMTLYIHAAQRLGATRGQIIFATAPFFGLLLSVVVLGEALQAIHALVALLFGGGITLLLLESHTHPHAHMALTHIHCHRHDDGHHAHRHSGLSTSAAHTHWHEHDPVTHAHPHWPDLHHRHTHQSDREPS